MPDTVESRLVRMEERQIALADDVHQLAKVIERLCELREKNTERITRVEDNQAAVLRVIITLQIIMGGIATWLGVR